LQYDPDGEPHSEGTELSGLPAAIMYAEGVAREMKQGRLTPPGVRSLILSDEAGNVLHELPLVLH
jgi:hypothetical protein